MIIKRAGLYYEIIRFLSTTALALSVNYCMISSLPHDALVNAAHQVSTPISLILRRAAGLLPYGQKVLMLHGRHWLFLFAGQLTF